MCDKVPLWCDNESATKISLRTKHIEIWYHLIRDHIRRGETELKYVNNHDNLADIFMNPLDEARFRELRHELNYHWFEQCCLSLCTPHHTQLVVLFRCRHGHMGSVVLSMKSPSPIMHKLINSFTLAIFDGTCASKTSFGHGPKDNSSRCHTNWLKHRWLRPLPSP